MIPNIRSTYISVFCQYRYLIERIKLTHLFVLFLFGNWHVPLLFVPNLSINVASHKSDPLFDIKKSFCETKNSSIRNTVLQVTTCTTSVK